MTIQEVDPLDRALFDRFWVVLETAGVPPFPEEDPERHSWHVAADVAAELVSRRYGLDPDDLQTQMFGYPVALDDRLPPGAIEIRAAS